MSFASLGLLANARWIFAFSLLENSKGLPFKNQLRKRWSIAINGFGDKKSNCLHWDSLDLSMKTGISGLVFFDQGGGHVIYMLYG